MNTTTQTQQAAGAEDKTLMSLIMKQVRANMKTYTMILALVIIWLLFGYLTNWIFFKPQNMSNLFRQMTIVSFLAMSMVLVIVTGNIDLSAGNATGFVSAVAAYVQAIMLPPLLANMSIGLRGWLVTIISIFVGLLVGAAIGVAQGSVVAYLNIPSFIVTLGGMLIFLGGILGVTQGKTIVPIEDNFRLIAQGYVPKSLGWALGIIVIAAIFFGIFWSRMQKGRYGFKLPSLEQDAAKAVLFSSLVILFVHIMNQYRGIPNPVLLMAVMALVFVYLTDNTKFGRYCYALGGNKEATRLSGVNIKKNIFMVFVLMGLMTGVGGIVLTGYVAAGTTGGGAGYELLAIASCILGGTSTMGGEGTIFGALVGSLIMASLQNGMSVMNMDIFWQYIIRGLVLVVAVYIDVLSKKSKA